MLISKKISRETQFRIEQAFFKIIYTTCRVLPQSSVLRFGTKLGNLAWRWKMSTSTSLENMRIALGHRFSPEEIQDIAKRCYQHFGIEIMRVIIMDRQAKRPISDWFDIEGLDLIKNRSKPGCVMVGGHIGCWEVTNFLIPQLGEKTTLFSGKHANQVVGNWLDDIRRKAGMDTLSSGDNRVELVERTKKEVIALLGDFRPSKAAIEVEFFGRKTGAPQGPALLSLLNDVDLFYFSCVKVGERMKVRIKKLEIEKTKSRKQNTQLLTQEFFNELQVDVEKYPEQYLWMHGRWHDLEEANYQDKDYIFGEGQRTD